MKIRDSLIIIMSVAAVAAGILYVSVAGNPATRCEGVDTRRERLRALIEEFRVEHGAYPEKLDDFNSATMVNTSILLDPWGREFQYHRPSRSEYRLDSVGPDGVVSTLDDAKDTRPQSSPRD